MAGAVAQKNGNGMVKNPVFIQGKPSCCFVVPRSKEEREREMDQLVAPLRQSANSLQELADYIEGAKTDSIDQTKKYAVDSLVCFLHAHSLLWCVFVCACATTQLVCLPACLLRFGLVGFLFAGCCCVSSQRGCKRLGSCLHHSCSS